MKCFLTFHSYLTVSPIYHTCYVLNFRTLGVELPVSEHIFCSKGRSKNIIFKNECRLKKN